MNSSHVQVPEAIVQVQQQFEQWRATKASRTKLPESFWQSATELARQHGLNPTAKALRLDYSALKRRVLGPPTPKLECELSADLRKGQILNERGSYDSKS